MAESYQRLSIPGTRDCGVNMRIDLLVLLVYHDTYESSLKAAFNPIQTYTAGRCYATYKLLNSEQYIAVI